MQSTQKKPTSFRVMDGAIPYDGGLGKTAAGSFISPFIDLEEPYVCRAVVLGWRKMLVSNDEENKFLGWLAEMIGFCIYRYNKEIERAGRISLQYKRGCADSEALGRSSKNLSFIASELNNLIVAFYFIKNPPILKFNEFIKVQGH